MRQPVDPVEHSPYVAGVGDVRRDGQCLSAFVDDVTGHPFRSGPVPVIIDAHPVTLTCRQQGRRSADTPAASGNDDRSRHGTHVRAKES